MSMAAIGIYVRVELFGLFCVMGITGDVSHLKSIPFSRHGSLLKTFSGYYYEPPTTATPTTAFLPEIIINKASFGADASNIYLPPSSSEAPMSVYLPPFNDDVPIPSTEPPSDYLPPEIVPPPSSEYLPPASDEGYYYPIPAPTQLKSIAHRTKPSALHIQVEHIRCLDGPDGHFQAAISVKDFIDNVPIVDINAVDPRCRLHLTGIKFHINITAAEFHRCNVHACGQKELCLRLRFPQIFGMKALDDRLLTLQCRLQKRVVTKTHMLRVGVSHANPAGNAVVYSNAVQSQLRSEIGLYRYASGGLMKSLSPGSAVRLGEELILRVQIKSDDGWSHSRLSDVTLQQFGANGDVLNTAQLVKSNGCVNPSMQPVCFMAPVFEAPLGYQLGFRAIMFQGMKSGDAMQVNVRIVGCVHRQDCGVNEHRSCIDDRSVQTQASRTKRNSINGQLNVDKDVYEMSNISFRVLLPAGFNESKPHQQHRLFIATRGKVAVLATLMLVVCLILSALIFLRFKAKRFYFVWDKY